VRDAPRAKRTIKHGNRASDARSQAGAGAPASASGRAIDMALAALSSASDDGGGLECAPGSRAAVLDERTSRHAFRLRVREEGGGLKRDPRERSEQSDIARATRKMGNQPDVVAVGVAGIPAADVKASTASCARGTLGAEPSTSVT
jgi:hypothetical protein